MELIIGIVVGIIIGLVVGTLILPTYSSTIWNWK